ncbi:hypothetical protein FBULB1_2617 [Fusarium bulbicola]|nr:hypothetical protein FBULB1_2617 [Fusarium bulbicola]
MAPNTLTSLPSEIRQQIFRECLQVDGGYVYDVQSDKLTNADGTAIDLSLLYTCRSIANDTRAMPLAVNTIRFSTIFRQDWCNLAGCFTLAATTHYVLEQDFVFHLAQFITPEMFAEVELICPGFQELLKIQLVEHNEWIHENENPEYIFPTDRLRPAMCSMVRQFMKVVDLFQMNGQLMGRLDFRLLPTEADANVRNAMENGRRLEWTQGELREATSYCLKLISEAQPDEFAKYVYKSLPHWIGSRPAEDFINLRFNLWDIPDRHFEASIFYWLLDAFAVVDSGVGSNCFTFVLEAGQHSDYCSEFFQNFIQAEISKSKAWKICLDTGLLASLRPSTWERNTTRYAKDPRFEKLVDQLVTETSSLRCDFNPGVPLDVDALVEDARLRDEEDIKWASKSLYNWVPLPFDAYHKIMVAPNFEFQTRQEYIESTQAESS